MVFNGNKYISMGFNVDVGIVTVSKKDKNGALVRKHLQNLEPEIQFESMRLSLTKTAILCDLHTAFFSGYF